MFKLCLDTTYEELKNQKLKKVVQQTIDVITNDEDILVNFLFLKKIKGNDPSLVLGVVQEEVAISTTIESEA